MTLLFRNQHAKYPKCVPKINIKLTIKNAYYLDELISRFITYLNEILGNIDEKNAYFHFLIFTVKHIFSL
jgi:hypothetical protein